MKDPKVTVVYVTNRHTKEIEKFRLDHSEKYSYTMNAFGDMIFTKGDRPFELYPREDLGRVTFEYED